MSMNEETKKDLKERLTPEQYDIVVNKGTEHPGTGEFLHHEEDGTYTCVSCGKELFSSEDKYNSGSGWPSFHNVVDPDAVSMSLDTSAGRLRLEASCAGCGAHLGHVFPDGPLSNTEDPKAGKHFCINSASLEFNKD